jgi:hypothetical protein
MRAVPGGGSCGVVAVAVVGRQGPWREEGDVPDVPCCGEGKHPRRGRRRQYTERRLDWRDKEDGRAGGKGRKVKRPVVRHKNTCV